MRTKSPKWFGLACSGIGNSSSMETALWYLITMDIFTSLLACKKIIPCTCLVPTKRLRTSTEVFLLTVQAGEVLSSSWWPKETCFAFDRKIRHVLSSLTNHSSSISWKSSFLESKISWILSQSIKNALFRESRLIKSFGNSYQRLPTTILRVYCLYTLDSLFPTDDFIP